MSENRYWKRMDPMTGEPGPVTEAGRALWSAVRRTWTTQEREDTYLRTILAIEAEARAEAVRSVREKIEFLDRKSDAGPGFIGGYGQALADLLALLDTLTETPE